MNRAFGLILLALAATGCLDGRIAEAERQATAREQEAVRLKETQVRSAERLGLRLRDEVALRTQEAAAAERKLGELREALVPLWKGDPKRLAEEVARAKLPPESVRALEQAQQAAGSTTVERQFADAVARDEVAALSPLVMGLEEALGYTATEEGEAEPEAARECDHAPAEYQCALLVSEEPVPVRRGLCQSLAGSWVLSTEEARLVVRRLLPEVTASQRVVRTLGRDFWIVRREFPEPVKARSAEAKAESAARVWYALLQLSGDAATERLALAAAEGTRIVLADLDGDRVDELVRVAPDGVRAAHYDRKGKDVALWSAEETCGAPQALAAGIAEACQEVERKAKEKAAAAAKLAAQIAQAPAPTKALESLRAAALRCDLPAAKQHVAKALMAQLTKELETRKETEEQAWSKLCEALRTNPKPIESLQFTAGTVTGDVATVTLSGEGFAADKAYLRFEDGAWKIAGKPED